jgi:Carboxypeptidase regulatory-like domain
MYHLPARSSKGATFHRRRLPICAIRPANLSLTTHSIASIVVLTALVLLSSSLRAQDPIVAIRGTITDATGAPIPQATITLKDTHTGWIRAAASRSDGQYQIEDLSPGDYEIAIAAPTFATTAQVQTLQVGADKTLNFELRPGQVRNRIDVRDTTSGVNLTNSQIGDNVSQVQVDNLPLNGRNFLELARLEPGVSVVSVANPGAFGNTFERVSLPGALFSETRISVDGATTNDRLNGGTLLNFSQESVQEFEIASFSLDPAISATGGGAINIVSRRGTNDVHGSAFFFFRDHSLAAYPGLHRDPGNPDPFFARRQSGFSLGGPFKRNQLFWFANYEHNNQDGVFDVDNNHPIFDKLNLVYPSPLNLDLFNFRIDGTVNPKNTAFLRLSLDRNNNTAPPAAGIFMPSNWQVSGSAGTQLAGGLTSILHPNVTTDLRFSYTLLNSRLGPMNAVQCQDPVRCLGVGGPEIQVFEAPLFRIGNQENAPFVRFPRTYQLAENLIWQRGQHRLRFGGEWEHLIVKGIFDLFDPAVVTLWGPTNLQPFPSLYNALPASLRETNGPPPTLSDILQLPLQSFTTGIGNPSLPGPFNFDKASHENELRFYFQDAWKLRPSLIFSYGIAYSYDPQLFNDDLQRPAYLAPLLGGNLRPPQPSTHDFDPAIGLVWGLGKNKKTVIRAGSGIYHDEATFIAKLLERTALGPSGNGRATVAGSVVGLSFLSTPTSFSGVDLLPLLPTIRSDLTSRLGDGTDLAVREIEVLKQGSFMFSPGQTTPYAIHVNAGFQRELAANWVLSTDYVMRRYLQRGGIQVAQAQNQIDQNRFNRPEVTGVDPSTGVVSFVRNPVIPLCTPAQAAALDPKDQCSTGPINFLTSGESYRYQALQVRLDKRFSSHFQLQISYALAKNSGFVAVTQYDDTSPDYGNIGTPRQLAIGTAVAEPPRYRGSSNLLRGLLNDWTIAIISEAHSGPPLDTMLTGLDLDGDGISNTLLPGTTQHNSFGEGLSAAALRGLIAKYNTNVDANTRYVTNPNGSVILIRPRTPFNQIVNTITLPDHFSSGDSFVTQDVRLAHRIMITERIKLSVIGEVFNIFNIANLTGYGNVLNGVNYGLPSARATQVFGSGGPRAFQVGTRIEF